MSLVPASSHGGGSSSLSATVTTDASTFLVEHVFDLGDLAVAYVKATVTALTPGGETFGGGTGDIGVGFGATPKVSADGVTFADGIGAIPHLDDYDTSGYMVSVSQFESIGFVTPRYLKLQLKIFDVDSGDPYAGSNHPTATLRIDVTYLA